MALKSPPPDSYELLEPLFWAGSDHPAGTITAALPPESLPWLLAQGRIRPVPEVAPGAATESPDRVEGTD